MNIKAVLTDFDGTLVDYSGKFEDATPSLIQLIKAKGIQVAVATGRACIGDVARTIAQLDLSPLNIVCGGGLIFNWKTGEAPHFCPLSVESTKKITEYFAKEHIVFSLETKTSAYMMALVETPAYPDQSVVKLFSLNTIPKDVLKILVHGYANKLPVAKIEGYIKDIQKMCKDVEVVKFSIREKYFGLDATAENSTKHTAVLEYAKINGYKPQEIVAIGDGYNDYPLFTACGYKIAMGNAPKELKEIADIVVNKAEEGGMSQALNHVLSLCE